MAERRALWKAWSVGLDPARLIFIDETWATTNMTRLRGRAPRGRRLVASVPHGHWKTTTLVAALDLSGLRCSMSLDGAIDRLGFEAFIEQVLAPSLRRDEIVVMDNLSSHKGPRVAQMVEAAGASLAYLPPYSPDLNPIEMAFAKLKQLLRGREHRDVDTLWSRVQETLDAVSASDAAGCFRHCGYTLRMK